MSNFFKNFHLSWTSFIDYLPALLGGIVCFLVTLLLANFMSKLFSKLSLKRTKDTLIANFIGKIAWGIIFILGLVLTLGILGLGTISDKILAGAGITTFVIGFALKDIGENFLAGLIIAFGRPFHVGSLIEVSGVKGLVKNMTMRQTTVEDENGRTTMIPNSMMINNPLIKYSNNDNNLRQEIDINVETQKVKEAQKAITDAVMSFDFVIRHEEGFVKVIIDSLNGDKVKLLVVFWYDMTTFKGSRSGSRSKVMLAIIDKLNEAGIKFSG